MSLKKCNFVHTLSRHIDDGGCGQSLLRDSAAIDGVDFVVDGERSLGIEHVLGVDADVVQHVGDVVPGRSVSWEIN